MPGAVGIFRAYDIRGIYPGELGPELALRIGLAYGSIASGRGVRGIYLGRDARLSGPALAAAFSAGAMASGLEVVDVGLVHTPLIYWLTAGAPHGGGHGDRLPQPARVQRPQGLARGHGLQLR
ncbi:MAG: hypothetical protein RXP77_02805 [Nitrososphaeria archaeon]